MAGAVIRVGTMPKRRSKRETIAFKGTGSVCAKLESSGCIAAILQDENDGDRCSTWFQNQN